MTKNGRTNHNIPLSELAELSVPSLISALRLFLNPSAFRQCPRFWHEGIAPVVHALIQASNTAIINQWLDQGTEVVFVSSFPRSGNTWMRYLLADVLLQTQNIPTSTQLPVHPDDLIPEFRGNSIINRLKRCPSWARRPPVAFVKTHVPYPRVKGILSGSQWHPFKTSNTPSRNCKMLYMYRSPDDALVSFYHLCLREPEWRSKTTCGIDAFCRKEVSGWANNISSYLRAADDGFPIVFISYEQLLGKTEPVLAEVLRWVGLPHDKPMVERAVSNMQFNKLQAMEIQENKARRAGPGQQLFFRHGRSGSGRVELQESTRQEVLEKTASLMGEINQRQMKQSPNQLQPVAVPA
jgi:hypothetical protein